MHYIIIYHNLIKLSLIIVLLLLLLCLLLAFVLFLLLMINTNTLTLIKIIDTQKLKTPSTEVTTFVAKAPSLLIDVKVII